MHQPPVVIKTPWLPYVKFARPPYIAVRKEKKKGVPTTLHSIKSPSVVLTLQRKFTHIVRKVHAHFRAVSFRLHCAQNASGVSWYRWNATQKFERCINAPALVTTSLSAEANLPLPKKKPATLFTETTAPALVPNQLLHQLACTQCMLWN